MSPKPVKAHLKYNVSFLEMKFYPWPVKEVFTDYSLGARKILDLNTLFEEDMLSAHKTNLKKKEAKLQTLIFVIYHKYSAVLV